MRKIIAVFSLVAPLVLMGCEQQGPMEEAGENVDETFEETGEAIEDSAEG